MQVFSHTPSLVRAKDSGFVAQASACGFLREQGKTQQPEAAAENGPHSFFHSEVAAATEESLFLFMELNRREIPRFAQNDKINYFFRSL